MKNDAIWLVLVLCGLMVFGLAATGCDDDDDDADASAGDADADSDGDADTDSDSDSDVYDGTLEGNIRGAGVTVWTGDYEACDIGVEFEWNAVDGNVDNISVNEFRLYFGDDTEPYYTTLPGAILPQTDFDGIVTEGPPQWISFGVSVNNTLGLWPDYCNEPPRIEADFTWGQANNEETYEYFEANGKVDCQE